MFFIEKTTEFDKWLKKLSDLNSTKGYYKGESNLEKIK
jgi:hypothetical protein